MSFATLEELWSAAMSVAFAGDGGPEMLFRGITDETHELVPSIGRGTIKNTSGVISTLETGMMSEFKRLTVPLLRSSPSSDFEWLFLAQHYGLPTRLLDWSTNPLVALYFATETDDDTDGALLYTRQIVTDQYEFFDYRTANYTTAHNLAPVARFAIQRHQGNVIFVRPKYSDERYLNQRSVFSCPADPFSPLAIPDVEKLTVPGKWKPELRKRLRAMGVSSSFIYPGIAGVAQEIRLHHFQPVTSGRMTILTLHADISLS